MLNQYKYDNLKHVCDKNNFEIITQTASVTIGSRSQIQIFLSFKLAPIAFKSSPLPFMGCFSIALLIKKNATPMKIHVDEMFSPNTLVKDRAAIKAIIINGSVLMFSISSRPIR